MGSWAFIRVERGAVPIHGYFYIAGQNYGRTLPILTLDLNLTADYNDYSVHAI